MGNRFSVEQISSENRRNQRISLLAALKRFICCTKIEEEPETDSNIDPGTNDNDLINNRNIQLFLFKEDPYYLAKKYCNKNVIKVKCEATDFSTRDIIDKINYAFENNNDEKRVIILYNLDRILRYNGVNYSLEILGVLLTRIACQSKNLRVFATYESDIKNLFTDSCTCIEMSHLLQARKRRAAESLQ